jgi:Protein of unknown function (DUF3168)
MSAEFEVQTALYAALTTLGLRVYDFAPQAKDGASTGTFPYVEVGHIIATDWDTDTENGFNVVARVHTYSRSASAAETRGIQSQIYDRLHHGVLTVTGQTALLIMREMSDCTRQTDGSFHGVCEYRILLATA